ncbi:MAG: hypothetical protein AAGD34_02850, partial [Pseudomonadota bacterium]
LNFDGAKEFAGHFDHGVEGGVPDGTGDGAIHLFADPQRLAAFARSGAAPVGLMLLSPEEGDTIKVGAGGLKAAAGLYPEGVDLSIRTGLLVIARTTFHYLLVCADDRRADIVADALDSFDPRNKPHLVTAALDITLPWRGSNAYPCETHTGFYMRWQGPDPIFRYGIAETLARLAKDAPLVRIEIFSVLNVVTSIFQGMRIYIGDRQVPYTINHQSGRQRLSVIATADVLGDLEARGVPPDLVVCLPLSLKGMPEGKEVYGRTFTYAISSVELMAYRTANVRAIAELPPLEDVDNIGVALANMRGQSKPVDEAGRARALYSSVDEGAIGRRLSLLNGFVDDVFFHRVQLELTGEGAINLLFERPVPQVTPEGYAYVATVPPVELTAARDGSGFALQGEALADQDHAAAMSALDVLAPVLMATTPAVEA